MIKELIHSMRPKQWYKNIVIFIGLVFSLNFLNPADWLNVIAAFVIFCILSGSIYIINDIIDVEKDRNHPLKRLRPLASGKLKLSHGLSFAIIFIVLAFAGSYLINIPFFLITLTFFFLILIYSLFLKNFLIVDILVISSGFVLRAIAGCLAISVVVSPWLIICTFLIALFLALGKRRHELIIMGGDAKNHRQILGEYSSEMLEQMINITTSILVMSYSLYTFFSNNMYMMLTIPFAFYGLFRYLYLVHSKNMGGEPEMIFKDRGMVLCLIFWVIIVLLILYMDKIIQII
ncbi:MAG: decaprenyl-phosphate phosphoribosyltransferase [Methanobacteriaceae archaeon]|jgi:4-hydroxybenzoate polyprenyltransferase|nr:MAG: decaprenyl-phosphate phosphoribosyltransferase [Methanobacterium sp. BRmetb2]MCC7557928.1 decaprenyl-phosphate phosphoribosyltransferase [Methanobacteriaceae archaeon]